MRGKFHNFQGCDYCHISIMNKLWILHWWDEEKFIKLYVLLKIIYKFSEILIYIPKSIVKRVLVGYCHQDGRIEGTRSLPLTPWRHDHNIAQINCFHENQLRSSCTTGQNVLKKNHTEDRKLVVFIHQSSHLWYSTVWQWENFQHLASSQGGKEKSRMYIQHSDFLGGCIRD